MEHEDLKQYATETRKFLTLQPGESYVGYYVSHKRIPDRFRLSEDPKATTIEYTLRDKEGREVKWTKSSGKIAIDMGNIPHGSPLSITMIKRGEYAIQAIQPKGTPTPVASAPATEEEVPF